MPSRQGAVLGGVHSPPALQSAGTCQLPCHTINCPPGIRGGAGGQLMVWPNAFPSLQPTHPSTHPSAHPPTCPHPPLQLAARRQSLPSWRRWGRTTLGTGPSASQSWGSPWWGAGPSAKAASSGAMWRVRSRQAVWGRGDVRRGSAGLWCWATAGACWQQQAGTLPSWGRPEDPAARRPVAQDSGAAGPARPQPAQPSFPPSLLRLALP